MQGTEYGAKLVPGIELRRIMENANRAKRQSNHSIAFIEDAQAVALDILIELGQHKVYQAALIAGAPPAVRQSLARMAAEDQETTEYLGDRARTLLAILAEARARPEAYDLDRPAIRLPRPVREAVEELLAAGVPA